MMHKGTLRRWLAGATLVLWASPALGRSASGDTPQIQNARVETRTLPSSLNDEVQRWVASSTKARWLGYSVPQVGGQHEICCSNYRGNSDRCGTCTLEGEHRGVNINSNNKVDKTIRLESSGELAVMLRAEGSTLSKIRVFSMQCTVDGGGLDILWLENVKSSDSVAMLEKFVTASKSLSEEARHDSLSKGALTAIALHDDASADRALQSFASPEQRDGLRRETAFWLGEARGAEGLRTLQKMARSDPSPWVREQVTFALSVSDQPNALNEMIRMAHEDQSPHVRGQALFWLAQKAGKQAENTISGAIENDPDTEVKKKAVFALSQMPKDEGVPKLIEVAQTNKNPEVRKQAMFWLGQSEDPRALAFFEKILTP